MLPAAKRQRAEPPHAIVLSDDMWTCIMKFLTALEIIRSMSAVSRRFRGLTARAFTLRNLLYFDSTWSAALSTPFRAGIALRSLSSTLRWSTIDCLRIIHCDALLCVDEAVDWMRQRLPKLQKAEVVLAATASSSIIPSLLGHFKALLRSTTLGWLTFTMVPDAMPRCGDMEAALLASDAPLVHLALHVHQTMRPMSMPQWSRLATWTDRLSKLTFLGLDVHVGDRAFLSALRVCTSLTVLDLALFISVGSDRILEYIRDMAFAVRDSGCPITDVQLWCLFGQHGGGLWRAADNDLTPTADVYRAWSMKSLECLDVVLPGNAFNGENQEIRDAYVFVLRNCPDLETWHFAPTFAMSTKFIEATMDEFVNVHTRALFGTSDAPTDACLVSRWLSKRKWNKYRGTFANETQVFVSDPRQMDWTVFGTRLAFRYINFVGPILLSSLPLTKCLGLELRGKELVADERAFAGVDMKGQELSIVGDLSRLTTEFFRHAVDSGLRQLSLMEWPDGKNQTAVMFDHVAFDQQQHGDSVSLADVVDRVRVILGGFVCGSMLTSVQRLGYLLRLGNMIVRVA